MALQKVRLKNKMAATELLNALVDRICTQKGTFGTVLIGFDGYIDRVVRLKKNQQNPPDFFEYIGDFAKHIQNHPGNSQDIMLKRISKKIGGNGPLMAESLALKNTVVSCIGAFGFPKLHPVYEPLSKMSTLISVEQTASTLVLEFNDAKIMLAEVESLDRITWKQICTVIGKESILSMMNGADIIGFTNWSGLSKSNDILEGILQFLCPRLEVKERIWFFDLADPSGKTPEQFADFFRLTGELSRYFTIILGLNRKETVLVYNRFFQCDEKSFSESMAQKLVAALGVQEVVVHGTDWAMTADKGNCFKTIKSIKIAEPLILTGAGDNFNAGYCLGKLCSLDIESCLYLANISASLYVKQGFPAGIQDIITHIRSIT